MCFQKCFLGHQIEAVLEKQPLWASSGISLLPQVNNASDGPINVSAGIPYLSQMATDLYVSKRYMCVRSSVLIGLRYLRQVYNIT